MGVRAVLADGREVELDSSHGSTPEEVVSKLAEKGFTGSAVPFKDAWLNTAGGGMVRYDKITDLKRDPHAASK